MTNKLTFVRKMGLILLAGTAFAGTGFASENQSHLSNER